MLRTLVVEDSLSFRQALKHLLCEEFPSMVLAEAEHGREALQKIGAFLPDLIFMDINLPGETGLEVTKRIKTNHSDTFIVILTGCDLPEYREAACRSGADYFLSKVSSNMIEEILALVEYVSFKKNVDQRGLCQESRLPETWRESCCPSAC